MSRPFDIVNIGGKKVIFLGALSKNYISSNYINVPYIPTEQGAERTVPITDIAALSFIPNTVKVMVKKGAERLIRKAYQDVENMNAYFNEED